MTDFTKVSSIKTPKANPMIPSYWIAVFGKSSKLIYADPLNFIIFRHIQFCGIFVSRFNSYLFVQRISYALR